MLWQPLNLTEACPADTQLTACSHFAYVYLNLLVRLYGDSRDRRIQESQHCEEEERIVESIEKHDREEYDFIVVGAGAAGCVVANRLSAIQDWKVLLLEAGMEQPDVTLVPALSTTLIGSNIDWAYSTEPNGKSCLARRNQRCGWPRGKVMGGSSTINSMAYIRGNKVDYDGWAALGNEGWSYDEVLPYFKKSEENLNIKDQYHGVHGEQPVSRYPYIDKPSIMMTDAFHEIGLPLDDYNGANQLATMQAQAFSKGGERVSTNNAFIQPIRYKRKNLTVRVESEVFEILINKNKTAYGVKYKRNETVYTAYAKKEVIVCGGTVNSPKLLMLSGIGPKEHLSKLNIHVKKDLPVGENLHDHVSFNGFTIVLPNKTATLVDEEEILQEVCDYSQMEQKNGPLAGNGPVSSIAFIKTDPNLPAPDIQYQIGHAWLNDLIREPVTYEEIIIFPTAYYNAMVTRTMNLIPKSRGQLFLNPENPHGKPLLQPNYLEDPTDLIPLIKGVRVLLSLEKTKAFKAHGAYFDRTPFKFCKDYLWGSDEYIECLARNYTASTYHPVGTCKMGPKSDKKAVVDPKLRVYGIFGLRVIDASIMPFVIRGNTNAPSIMIGERGVAIIIQDWLKKLNKTTIPY